LSDNLRIVDSHAHLGMDDFSKDLKDVLKRSGDAGVLWVLVPATDVESSRVVVELCEKYDSVYGAVGIHPHDADKAKQEDVEEIASLLTHPKVKAVGEIGLDFYYSFSAREVQERIFSMQLALAAVSGLPVVIHSRDAVDEALSIIDACDPDKIKGVFHCFTGSVKELDAVIERGFYVSVGGMVTFKNFQALDVVKKIPLDKLLVETDAPYLTPVPFRGKRNEPAFLPYTIEKLAEIYNKSADEISAVTSENAERLFNAGKES